MTNVARATVMLLPPALAIIGCGNAMAYRPFDGTDASVADLDKIGVTRRSPLNCL